MSRQLSCMLLPLPGIQSNLTSTAPALHFRIQLNDELLVDRQIQLRTSWQRANSAGKRIFVYLDPFRNPSALGEVHRLHNPGNLPTCFFDLDFIPRTDKVRGDGDSPLVYEKVPMPDQLPGF